MLEFAVIVPSAYMIGVREIANAAEFKAGVDGWWASYPLRDQYTHVRFDWQPDCTFTVHVRCASAGAVVEWPFDLAARYMRQLVKIHCDARGPDASIVVDVPRVSLGSCDLDKLYTDLEGDLLGLEVVRRKDRLTIRGTSPPCAAASAFAAAATALNAASAVLAVAAPAP